MTDKLRIYLSGPMSGLPEHNFPAFNAKAAELRAHGYDVVNPVDVNPDPGKSWTDCLRDDIAALTTCNAIWMLDGWQNSKGATLERHIADRLGFAVLFDPLTLDNLNPPAEALTFGPIENPKAAAGAEKVPLFLLSSIAKAKWALAQFAGMAKYGAWNWRAAGITTSTYLSAMERHMDAFKEGEDFDPVDGTDHLGNIMACAAILIDARAAGKLTDDRPPSVGVRAAYAEVEAQMAVLRERYKDLVPKHYTIADKV